jgi:hypothetical protein
VSGYHPHHAPHHAPALSPGARMLGDRIASIEEENRALRLRLGALAGGAGVPPRDVRKCLEGDLAATPVNTPALHRAMALQERVAGLRATLGGRPGATPDGFAVYAWAAVA